jgi:hypothetical protein
MAAMRHFRKRWPWQRLRWQTLPQIASAEWKVPVETDANGNHITGRAN